MQTDKELDKLFLKRFMFSMLVFLLLIAVQTFSLELLDMAMWLQVTVTILPTLPLIWAFFIYRRRFILLDEYMQRRTGEAFLWTTGIISFVTFTYGMLALKFPMPDISIAYILPVIFGGHGLILQLLLMVDNHEK
ncbi:MAG: hypothetical protein OCD00_02465 [Colwellia sp.]